MFHASTHNLTSRLALSLDFDFGRAYNVSRRLLLARRYVCQGSKFRGRMALQAGLKYTLPLHRPFVSLTMGEELVYSDAQKSTIYALSTPPGKAGVAVIRVSGPDALRVWQNMVNVRSQRAKGKERESVPEPWRLYRCDIVHPSSAELLDSGLAVYFKAPRSFTGEDVVELHIHSGRAVISSVLEALGCEPTCRLAGPGEFTRRAFEAGRVDLTEVEGLHDLINAETASQRRAALQAAGGKLKTRFLDLKGDILQSLAFVEALIDFSEEDVEDGAYIEAKQIARSVVEKINAILSDYPRGEILRSGIRMAIFGPPNAGKSSLLNLLAQRDAAIVTDIPGTTRDVLEVSLDIGGLPVVVADTAGIRQTQDLVEKIGVERAADVVKDADIALCVLSLEELVPDNECGFKIPEDLAGLIDESNTMVLLNKSDLLAPSKELDLRAAGIIESVTQALRVKYAWVVSIDMNAGINTFLRDLGKILKERYEISDQSNSAAPIIINARHQQQLEKTLLFLNAFIDDPRHDIVLAAEELRYAAKAIGDITGGVDVEDILDVIFRDFCIGK